MMDSGIFTDIKRREALRQNEPELRSLKQKLHNDLIRRTQECQIKEKEYACLREKINASQESEIMYKKQIKDNKLQIDKVNEIRKSKQSYGNELQLQMQFNEISKINEAKNKELERIEMRKMLDDLAQENILYIEKKKQLIEQLQVEREVTRRAREVEKNKNKLQSFEESRRIDEINRELVDRLRRQEEEHRKKLMIRESLNIKIAKNLEEQQTAEMERTKLIEELREYEFKQNEDLIDKHRNVKDQYKIKSHKDILETQIAANLAHKQMLQDLEYQYKIQLLNEMKKYKRFEDLQRKHMKEEKIEYANCIKKQIDLNANKKNEFNDLMKMTNEYIKQFNATRENQIQEEKNLMILEHKQKFP